MDNVFESLGEVAGLELLNDQEVQKLAGVNYEQTAAPYVYQGSPSNPEQELDPFFLGFDGINLSPDGIRNENFIYFADNDQGPNSTGDLNFQVEIDSNSTQLAFQRIRWTDDMVKLMINIVSYVGEDVSSCDSTLSERSHILTPVKGKWRVISNTMVERGFMVSPQQCEDKFNDINKKFKRLNEILGRINSFTVVQNPALLEFMENIPNKAKDEVRKILACKQLFYHEMSSYHDGTRMYLPHDEALQKSVQAALKGKTRYRYSKSGREKISEKRMKQEEDRMITDSVAVVPEYAVEGQSSEMDQWAQSQLLQLEVKKLQIQKEMLELENQKFQWLKICQLKDKELHKMKSENEIMKLQNERMAFERRSREKGHGGC